jgi:hypothetical protein
MLNDLCFMEGAVIYLGDEHEDIYTFRIKYGLYFTTRNQNIIYGTILTYIS